MVLIFDRMPADPRIKKMGHSALWLWVAIIGRCNQLDRDTLAIDELDEVFEVYAHWDREKLLNELESGELVKRLPHGHLKVLARLDLWAFDHEREW